MLLAGGGYLIWHFTGRPSVDDAKAFWEDFDFSDFTDVLGNWTDDMDFGDFYDNDPFVGDNTTNNWKTDGTGGLKLTMVNALDDLWQQEFTDALNDWENGDPDTLTLTTQRVAVDNGCAPEDGVMKVCNGNYKENGWLGINEMSLSGGKIISSVAKMNEFYLHNADYDKRRYTMCHEIGHGFGLPHTDEQFNNADQGNCLDYTNNPSANLRPGKVNFERLKELYGTVPARRMLRSTPEDKSFPLSFPPELMQKYEQAMKELEQVQMKPQEGTRWRRLREHKHGSVFARRLSKDFTLQVQVLYADPNSNLN